MYTVGYKARGQIHVGGNAKFRARNEFENLVFDTSFNYKLAGAETNVNLMAVRS